MVIYRPISKLSRFWMFMVKSIRGPNSYEYVSNIINDLHPDIIKFCEVEGCDELNQLASLTNNKYRPYLIQGTDSATGQNVGMLTLVDPVES